MTLLIFSSRPSRCRVWKCASKFMSLTGKPPSADGSKFFTLSARTEIGSIGERSKTVPGQDHVDLSA
ncbi:hypothetical protein BGX21_003349, partial [Mortierella sp. AD011]